MEKNRKASLAVNRKGDVFLLCPPFFWPAKPGKQLSKKKYLKRAVWIP